MPKIMASQKKSFIWNLIGSGINAATTLFLTVFTTRLSGKEDAGIIGVALGLSFIVGTIGFFEVRPYQSSDVSRSFSFSDYLAHRWITCAFMIAVTAVYLFWLNGLHTDAPEKMLSVFFVCMYRMSEGYADVYQGLFQQEERMDLSGKSLAIHTVVSNVLFFLVLVLSGNLVIATLALFLGSVSCIFAVDRRWVRLFGVEQKPSFDRVRLYSLFAVCLPLFLSAFMSVFEINITKLQIERYITDQQAYWNALSLPAALINLFSIFVFRPMLTDLSYHWIRGEYSAFQRKILGLSGVIAAISAATLLGGFFLGLPLLEILYGIDLSGFRTALMLVLAGGSCNAFSNCYYYCLALMRKQRYVLIGESVAFLFAVIASPVFVRQGGLQGAALVYMITMFIRFFFFLLLFLIQKGKAIRAHAPNLCEER